MQDFKIWFFNRTIEVNINISLGHVISELS